MMRKRGCFGVVVAAVCLSAIFCGRANGQTPDAGPVLRIKGIIDQNQTWSGRVLLTGDVEVSGATITIEPGTLIEFARETSGRAPVFIVGSTRTSGGELKIKATADAPVEFRADPDKRPGRLVINVRNKVNPGRVKDNPLEGIEPSTIEPNDVTWRYVRFVGLGKPQQRGGETLNATIYEAGLTFNVTGGPHTFRMANCEFEGCTRVSVRGGDKAKLSIESCRFGKTNDPVSLEVQGNLSGEASEYVFAKANVADSAFSFAGAPTTVADNVLIGEHACLVIDRDVRSPCRIVGNYIHNTTTEYDGRYCVDCRTADATIERNVIRGATTLVLNGGREMRENVLIGTMLRSETVKNARTQNLVRSLPLGSVFERNLLLGPAYSMLAPQAGPTKEPGSETAASRPTIVQHNLFDGFDEGRRAIHLNPLGAGIGKVAIYNNVFIRTATLVYDESRTAGSLMYLDYNAVAPKPARAFDGVAVGDLQEGKPGFASADVVVGTPTRLRLRDLPKRLPEDVDDAVRNGSMSVERYRKSLFVAYAPLADSPLVGAGHRMQAGAEKESAQPSIGPREPSN